MNPEDRYPQNTETSNPPQQPAKFSGDSAGPGELGRIEGESPATAIIPYGIRRPMFVITGVALCMGLASCVVPYDSPGGTSVAVSSYRPGYTVTSLPGGYRSENISGSTYYYHNGSYYRPGSGGYVIVDAPRSSRYYDDYNRLQRNYQTGRNYQDSSSRRDGRYDRSDVITRLPDGYRQVNHRGNTYYQAGDRYYRRQGETYVITTRPY